MFCHRVEVISLGDIDQQVPASLQDPDVLTQQSFRLLVPEMLQQSLMEDNIKRFIAKWKPERISADDGDRKLFSA
jgi:hypothetical protein